MTNKQKQKDDS